MVGVLCVGFAALDHVFGVTAMPHSAEKYRAHRFAAVGGGNAANAAVAIARLGAHALLATRVGDDDIGTSILAGLARDGVDCSLSRRVAGHASGISAIVIDADGERMIINYSDEAMPNDVGALADAITPAIGAVMADARWDKAAIACFTKVRAQGGFAVADIDRLPRDPGLATAASHIVLSAQALRLITGHEDLADALLAYRQNCSGWLAVTDGARGVYYLSGDIVRHFPAFAIEAVDTLGAGDVFHGAFALALAEGQNEEGALRFASGAAALKCTKFGGRSGSPTRAELDAFLRGTL